MPSIPTFESYMLPTIEALKQLGGSASVQELNEAVPERMKLSDDQLAVPHDPDRGNQTEVAYRMAWARTYLKKAGFIENSQRGVWALTATGRGVDELSGKEIARGVRTAYNVAKLEGVEDVPDSPNADEGVELDAPWRARLLQILLSMPSDAFERLCQRILRECGFVEVEVTGRTGDGGIDGTGIIRLQYVVSFQVLFQCKRWKGTVGSREIRDFRGAMVGRTDKGLFITTGTFSRDAQKEATRDGAPPIDLIDGEQLVDLIRRTELGVRTEIVERVVIEPTWFDQL